LLQVPASDVGLENRVVTGMAFALYNGRATWDYAGKTGLTAAPPPTYTLSGTVALNGAGLGGVGFAASNGASCANSNSAGLYTCSVPQNWSGTIAPSLSGYSFTPASRAYSTVSANQASQDYAAANLAATTVWVEDALPTGAIAGGNEAWTWISANPAPYSGAKSHQSALVAGEHQHLFTNATSTLTPNTGDILFAYVYLDPANPPREIMLKWNDGTWEHRAYWGENLMLYGVNGAASRRYMGPLPSAGQWALLQVPASDVGLENRVVTGMAFALYNGRAAWDYVGKTSAP
jgi:hypothetical protein